MPLGPSHLAVVRCMALVRGAMACGVRGAMRARLVHDVALRPDGVAGPVRLGLADGAGGLAGLQLLDDTAEQAPHAWVVHEACRAPAADQLVVRAVDVGQAQHLYGSPVFTAWLHCKRLDVYLKIIFLPHQVIYFPCGACNARFNSD